MKPITYTLLLASSFLMLGLPSCKKPEPGKAIITILDSLEDPIKGALIELSCIETNCVKGLSQSEKTDRNGQAEFEYTEKVIVLHANITATYWTSNGAQLLQKEEYVQFKEDQVLEYTFYLP